MLGNRRNDAMKKILIVLIALLVLSPTFSVAEDKGGVWEESTVILTNPINVKVGATWFKDIHAVKIKGIKWQTSYIEVYPIATEKYGDILYIPMINVACIVKGSNYIKSGGDE
jgi:hypothetical protein